MAALIAMRPGLRTRPCYTIRTHRGRKDERKSFSEHGYIALLDSAHQQLRAPIILVWDRLSVGVAVIHHPAVARHHLKAVVRRTRVGPPDDEVSGADQAVKDAFGVADAMSCAHP